jgi:magnesium-transporting ATPase (P-type)
VPEGLLPTITLALAVAVAGLARRGALVKRLSAVETLGSTDVICTDKTGTLTENRMRAVRIWTAAGELDLEQPGGLGREGAAREELGLLDRAVAAASTADLAPDGSGKSRGEATEIGLLEAARALGVDVEVARREHARQAIFRFDSRIRLMSSVDERADGTLTVHGQGAPEAVDERSTTVGRDDGRSRRPCEQRCSRPSSGTRRSGCESSPLRGVTWLRVLPFPPSARTRSASCVSSGSWRSSTRHAPKSRQRSPAVTPPGSRSTS